MNIPITNIITISIASLLIGACSTQSNNHWDYDHQDKWVFESGKMQSPINIDTKTSLTNKPMANLQLKPEHRIRYIKNNGHSIEVGGAGKMLIDNRLFNFQQVHFHAPSEHTIDGVNTPMEAHFVNDAANGRLAVIGVLLTEGPANPAFEKILQHIDQKSPPAINLSGLLPKNFQYYHYLGSLTTPPLSENVEWYILENPVTLSKAQIKTFQQYYQKNNRTLQALNNRPILKH